ncbi:MAG: hypothetical protein ACQGVC_22875 [Myxococcota bacterium]
MRFSRPIALSTALAAAALTVALLSVDRSEPVAAPPPPPTELPGVAARPEPAPPVVPDETDAAASLAEADPGYWGEALLPGQDGYDNDFRTDYSEGYWRGAGIEEMREAIYARQIDRLDRLHLLDEFVETGDRDTRELWETEWGSADDFKDEGNGFALQKGEDGRFYFVPDAATMRQNSLLEPLGTYEYHEDGKVFVQKTHYYGKPMVSALKFLREDVVVMMIVSGDKVDLNIYEQARD